MGDYLVVVGSGYGLLVFGERGWGGGYLCILFLFFLLLVFELISED